MLIAILVALAIYKYGIPTLDGQVAHEIDKLNLPVDSIQVDYEGKNLILYNLDLKPILFAKATTQNDYKESSLYIPRVEIVGIDWWQLYQEELLTADHIIIDGLTGNLKQSLLEYVSVKRKFPIDEVDVKKVTIRSSKIECQGELDVLGKFDLQLDSLQLIYPDFEVKMSRLSNFDLQIPDQVKAQDIKLQAAKDIQEFSCDKLSIARKQCNFSNTSFVLRSGEQEVSVSKAQIGFEIHDLQEFFDSGSADLQAVEIQDANQVSLRINPELPFVLGSLEKHTNIGSLRLNSQALSWVNLAQPDLHYVKSQAAVISVNPFSESLKKRGKSSDVLSSSDVRLENVEFAFPVLQASCTSSSVEFLKNRVNLKEGILKFQNGDKVAFNGITVEDEDVLSIAQDAVWDIDKLHIDVSELTFDERKKDLLQKLTFEKLMVSDLQVKGSKLAVDTEELKNVRTNAFELQLTTLAYEKGKAKKAVSFKKYDFSASNISSTTTDYKHSIKVKYLESQERNVVLRGIDLRPSSRNTGAGSTQTKYIITVPTVRVEDVLVSEFLEGNPLSVGRTVVENADVTLITDENIAASKGAKQILSEMILDVETQFYIKEVNARNAGLTFRYTPAKDQTASKINFKKLKVVVKNVTNMRGKLANAPLMELDGHGVFMTETPFSIDIQFNMVDKNFPYQYVFELGKLNLPDVNEMLADLTGLKIKEGQMDKMKGNINADKTNSKGLLDFYYRDLQVRYDREMFIAKWNPVDFMVTRFFLNKDNREEWHHETGIIEQRRDISKSMFYQIWEAVFDGMKYVMLPVI